MSAAPKRRRRNRAQSTSPQPIHYIDLTSDSPMPAARQTRGRVVSQGDEQICNETSTTNARQNFELSETIIIDAMDPVPSRESPPRRVGRPKKRAPATTSAAASEEDPVIEIDTSIISADPTAKLIPQINDSVDGSPTVLTCPVCFEDLRASRKPMSTKCGHIYCEECLLATLSTQKKCPNCKGPITRKSCHRIYF